MNCIVLWRQWTSLLAQPVRSLPAMQETWIRSLGWEDSLEKEMVTHSSILAWEIPLTEEPYRLYSSWGCRVGHDWVTSLLSLSVQFSRSVVSDSLRPHEPQHSRPLCPSPTPGVHSDSRPSSHTDAIQPSHPPSSPSSPALSLSQRLHPDYKVNMQTGYAQGLFALLWRSQNRRKVTRWRHHSAACLRRGKRFVHIFKCKPQRLRAWPLESGCLALRTGPTICQLGGFMKITLPFSASFPL